MWLGYHPRRGDYPGLSGPIEVQEPTEAETLLQSKEETAAEAEVRDCGSRGGSQQTSDSRVRAHRPGPERPLGGPHGE